MMQFYSVKTISKAKSKSVSTVPAILIHKTYIAGFYKTIYIKRFFKIMYTWFRHAFNKFCGVFFKVL